MVPLPQLLEETDEETEEETEDDTDEETDDETEEETEDDCDDAPPPSQINVVSLHVPQHSNRAGRHA